MLFRQRGPYHTVPPGTDRSAGIFQALHARLPSRRPSGTMEPCHRPVQIKLARMGFKRVSGGLR